MQHAIRHIHEELASVYHGNELNAVTRLLLSHVSGFDYTGLLVNKNNTFSQNQTALLNFYLQELKKKRPIQYVLGFTEFCGLKFKVDERVLIPRPETEELVEWIVSENRTNFVILDIGTGSGCIPVSLKKMLPESEVNACDISEDALTLANINANDHQAEVQFFQYDILQEKNHEHRYDVIVSNPPYVPLFEKSTLESQVVDYEPHIALFVPDNDPLLFYKHIAKFALKQLNEAGKLYFEIHRDYATEIHSLLVSMNFDNICLKKDIHGNQRMISAIRR